MQLFMDTARKPEKWMLRIRGLIVREYLCLPVPPTAFRMGVHHTVNPVHTVSPILKLFIFFTLFPPNHHAEGA
jgi:hypothetical protein